MAEPLDDPALDLLRAYRKLNAGCDVDEDDAIERQARFIVFAMVRNDLPPIRSREGAVEAIRAALEEDAFLDGTVERLLRAALAWLEREGR